MTPSVFLLSIIASVFIGHHVQYIFHTRVYPLHILKLKQKGGKVHVKVYYTISTSRKDQAYVDPITEVSLIKTEMNTYIWRQTRGRGTQ